MKGGIKGSLQLFKKFIRFGGAGLPLLWFPKYFIEEIAIITLALEATRMTQVVATGLEEPVIVIIFYTNIFSCWEGKGSKKETEKVWSFAKPPSAPPPFGLFLRIKN